ncbi:uncharacterized protein [Scyliorhinus torazame]|uniref:uncharacterized protein isoform X2 n=1 Tax=Scyliorhinus torazame TaxID=75743 RepID=UPI003B5C4C6B
MGRAATWTYPFLLLVICDSIYGQNTTVTKITTPIAEITSSEPSTTTPQASIPPLSTSSPTTKQNSTQLLTSRYMRTSTTAGNSPNTVMLNNSTKTGITSSEPSETTPQAFAPSLSTSLPTTTQNITQSLTPRNMTTSTTAGNSTRTEITSSEPSATTPQAFAPSLSTSPPTTTQNITQSLTPPKMTISTTAGNSTRTGGEPTDVRPLSTSLSPEVGCSRYEWWRERSLKKCIFMRIFSVTLNTTPTAEITSPEPSTTAPQASIPPLSTSLPTTKQNNTQLLTPRYTKTSTAVGNSPNTAMEVFIPLPPDIDECATNTSTCQQICMNTIGSFRCSCHPGFSINVMNTSLCDVQLKVILRLSVISDDVNLSDQEIREKFRQFLQGNGRMPSI